MKRNVDLQRQLLLEVEACDEYSGLQFVPEALLTAGGYPEGYLEAARTMSEFDEYNLKKLVEAGFLQADWLGEFWAVNLTHNGHDYLDAIRSDGIWAQTIAAVAETGGSATLEVLKLIAVGFAKKKLSEHTGIQI